MTISDNFDWGNIERHCPSCPNIPIKRDEKGVAILPENWCGSFCGVICTNTCENHCCKEKKELS